jgi:hypothetical protein
MIGATLLSLRFASETTVVDFEIICGKDQEIRWCFVSDTLYNGCLAGEIDTKYYILKAQRRLSQGQQREYSEEFRHAGRDTMAES